MVSVFGTLGRLSGVVIGALLITVGAAWIWRDAGGVITCISIACGAKNV